MVLGRSVRPGSRANRVCRRRTRATSVKGMQATGWYRDPYGLHDHRWFADGNPTSRVRDGGAESYDPSPGGAPPQFFRGHPVYQLPSARVGWLGRPWPRWTVLLPGLLTLGVLGYFWSFGLIPALFVVVLLVAGRVPGRRRPIAVTLWLAFAVSCCCIPLMLHALGNPG